MNITRSIVLITLLGGLPILAACGSHQANSDTKVEDKSFISNVIKEGIAEAREEIRTGNLSISQDEKNLPKAEITPQGDLLISDRTIAINSEQRALLLEYRAHLTGVAESGMEIGMQGADLATKAMSEAFKGVFSGKSGDEIEAKIEAEADEIKASAAKLCTRLPALLASQQQLAAALPEFKPYATMDQSDVDDCGEDLDTGTGKKIKIGTKDTGFHANIDIDSDEPRLNAAQEAEAASETTKR